MLDHGKVLAQERDVATVDPVMSTQTGAQSRAVRSRSSAIRGRLCWRSLSWLGIPGHPRSIQRRYSTLILRSAEGIPYLAPEIVLLFKARHFQSKDHDDLATAALLLTAPQRTWLTTVLRQVHPGYPWPCCEPTRPPCPLTRTSRTSPSLNALHAAIEDVHPKRGDAYLCNLTYRSSHRARAGGAGEKGESALLSAHVAAHLDGIGDPAVPL